jgi:sulfate permease, SulP family
LCIQVIQISYITDEAGAFPAPHIPMTLQPWKIWLGRVNRQSLPKDMLAGLTGALIVLPQGMAYALIAGLPPQYGLYCAIAPAIVAALFGSSWHLVSGPTAAISIVVFATLSPMAATGSADYIRMALTLGFLAGLIQVVLAVLHLGRLTDRIAHSVIVGFTTGASFLIAASQLKHFLGLQLPAGNEFFPTLWSTWQALPHLQWPVVIVGATTLIAALIARRWFKPLPHMVVGMVVGACTAAWLAHPAVKLVGALPSAVPQLSSPSWDMGVWRQLAVSAAVISLLALTEAIAIARAVALRSGQTIDGNQETFGQGLSNLTGAFLSGYPSSGSFTRSGVNFEAGAQTPLAAVFASIILMAVLFFVAPLVGYLPIASMAGVLFIVAWGLVDKVAIKACFAKQGDAAVFLLTFLACLFTDIEIAVFAGIALSMALGWVQRRRGMQAAGD